MSAKRKALTKLATPAVKSSAKVHTKSAIDESRASVAGTDALASSQAETIEISSDAASDEDLSDEDYDDDDVVPATQLNDSKATESSSSHPAQANGDTSKQLPSPIPSPVSKTRNVGGDDEGEESTSPSFGELLRGNETIDVPALLQQSSTGGLAARSTQLAIVPPSLNSLTTVLSQALRTDDLDLLESCLHTTDVTTIQNTIENIDSRLAAKLLSRLAARLHRRPGRAGSLTTWVKWTLIAHGGALASQPKVLQSLGGLQKVLAERAKGLNSLLALKGKLDLLEGQMELRRNLQTRNRANIEDDDDDADVIYVEGELERVNGKNTNARRRKRQAVEDEDEDDGIAMNGVMGNSSDEDDSDEVEEDSDEEEEELLDEDEVDHEDVDESMGEDDDSDVEAAPPAKLQKTAGSFSKRK